MIYILYCFESNGKYWNNHNKRNGSTWLQITIRTHIYMALTQSPAEGNPLPAAGRRPGRGGWSPGGRPSPPTPRAEWTPGGRSRWWGRTGWWCDWRNTSAYVVTSEWMWRQGRAPGSMRSTPRSSPRGMQPPPTLRWVLWLLGRRVGVLGGRRWDRRVTSTTRWLVCRIGCQTGSVVRLWGIGRRQVTGSCSLRCRWIARWAGMQSPWSLQQYWSHKRCL